MNIFNFISTVDDIEEDQVIRLDRFMAMANMVRECRAETNPVLRLLPEHKVYKNPWRKRKIHRKTATLKDDGDYSQLLNTFNID